MQTSCKSIETLESPSLAKRTLAQTVPGVPVIVLFSLTMFTGSGLLFLVQPMFGKLVLPYLGGSPSVWNTCMLFFQALLLLGYVYAHVSTRVLRVRQLVIAHLGLLCAPLLVLPIAVTPPDGGAPGSPVGWLLTTAGAAVGLPFFVVSTTAPLLQRWFAALPHPSARDPYFLYAASNLGSIVALLAYPFVLEPSKGLAAQTQIWAWGYGAFVLLNAGCAIAIQMFAIREPITSAESPVSAPPAAWRDRLFWLAMAFVPSTLMLGVTTHISTDIAAFPLLWIIPLAIYLLTFVVAFSPGTAVHPRRLAVPAALLAFAAFASLLLNADMAWLIPLHLLTFGVAALLCHLWLAHTRPGVPRLTEFYICLSVGGLLGGSFNGLIAPVLFATVLEYPVALVTVMIVAAAAIRPGPPAAAPLKWGFVAAAGLLVAVSFVVPQSSTMNQANFIASAALAALVMLERRNIGAIVRSVVLVALIFVVATGRARPEGILRHTERSFFGMHRVLDARDGSHRVLYHGSTLHGWQALPDRSCEPGSYYSRSGPLGDLFAMGAGAFERVAIVGLGIGAIACYAGPGDSWTFYEIDAVVERLATNPAYFTQIENSAGDVNVIVADGRLGLQRAAPASYDLLILDAFSSDSIPVHLLTREALVLYFSRLTAEGIVAVHISNRYLELEPVLGALQRELGLHGYARSDRTVSREDIRLGRMASRWVVLARRPERLLGLARRQNWSPLAATPAVRVWTDDYSNVLEALLLRYGLR